MKMQRKMLMGLVLIAIVMSIAMFTACAAPAKVTISKVGRTFDEAVELETGEYYFLDFEKLDTATEWLKFNPGEEGQIYIYLKNITGDSWNGAKYTRFRRDAACRVPSSSSAGERTPHGASLRAF